MFKDYYTVKEVAKIEGCTEKTIIRRIRDGKIWGAYPEGRFYRIPKESYDEYKKGEETHRRFVTERNILRGASSTISILGINSLGILHQNREMLINKLNEGVRIRILLLDPNSEDFKERAHNEEYKDGNISGRLRAESLASYAICKDIYNFVITSNKKYLSLCYFSLEPTMAMIITDHEKENGYCSFNQYPYQTESDEPIKNIRGLCGEYVHFPNSKSNRIAFQNRLGKFNEIWNEAEDVDLSKKIDI